MTLIEVIPITHLNLTLIRIPICWSVSFHGQPWPPYAAQPPSSFYCRPAHVFFNHIVMVDCSFFSFVFGKCNIFLRNKTSVKCVSEQLQFADRDLMHVMYTDHQIPRISIGYYVRTKTSAVKTEENGRGVADQWRQLRPLSSGICATERCLLCDFFVDLLSQ